MDYSISEALQYRTAGLVLIFLLYDIMCQYWVNFLRRFQGSQYLTVPPGMQIKRGIGLFHVHGHQDSCLFRFAPSFVSGARMIDGEILETLWEPLNGMAASTRTSTLALRQEVLDDHMGDSNFKKMIRIGPSDLVSFSQQCSTVADAVNSTSKKYHKVLEMSPQSESAFDDLTDRSAPDLVDQWRDMEKKAKRDRWTRLDAMDIYDVRISKGEGLHPDNDVHMEVIENAGQTMAQVLLEMTKADGPNIGRTGGTLWIADGLKIEEAQ